MKHIKMIAAEEVIRDQRVIKEVIYLSELGYNVEILCWDREGEFTNKEFEYVHNVKIKRFYPRATYGSGWKQIVPFLKFIREIRKYLKNQEYEYLHCQNLDGFVAGYLVNNKKKIVFDMREYYEGREKNKLKKFIIKNIVRFAVNKSYSIIYVNNTQISKIDEREKSKFIHLPNYPKASLGICNKKEKLKETLNITYIGAVRQYKEFINLFEAVKNMDTVIIDIHGSGTAYNKLKEVENQYKNVNITGTYSPSKTAELYSNADISYCVYSMENENWRTGYSIKFFESIITKTPIIVSKGSALEELVTKHGIGFIVDGSNIKDINELIIYISNNKEILKEKERNIEKIQYKYTWENVVGSLNQVYNDY